MWFVMLGTAVIGLLIGLTHTQYFNTESAEIQILTPDGYKHSCSARMFLILMFGFAVLNTVAMLVVIPLYFIKVMRPIHFGQKRI